MLSAAFLFAFAGCKKKGELQPTFDPNNSGTGYAEFTNLPSEVIREDSVLTNKVSSHLLGALKDGTFGTTYADLYTEFSLGGTYNVSFGQAGEVLEADSVVLTLAYNNQFGPKDGGISLEIYELTENLDNTIAYYSNDSAAHSSTPLSKLELVPGTEDSVLVDNSMTGPHLRVKLNKSLADKLIKASSTDLLDDESFQSYFNGLYIKGGLPRNIGGVKSGSSLEEAGNMAGLNLTGIETALTLYYRNKTTGDTTNYKFIVNSECQRFSSFKHDYTGSLANAYLNHSNSDSSLMMIQAMAGLYTKLDMSTLLTFKDSGNILFNKVVLEMKCNANSNETFDFPGRLVVVKKNEQGQNAFIRDFREGLSFYGGELIESPAGYTFNITHYANSALNGNSPIDLYVLISGTSVNASRVVLNSAYAEDPIKLKVYYTKLPD